MVTCLVVCLTITIQAQVTPLEPGTIHPYQINHVSWSPNGTYIVTGHRGGISLWEGTTGELINRYPLVNNSIPHLAPNVGAVAWHPDETKLAVRLGSVEGSVIQIIDIPDGNVLLDGVEGGRITSLTWHPDGDKLVFLFIRYANDNVDIHVINAQNGEILEIIPIQDRGAVSQLTFSPDGSKFAVSSVLFNNPSLLIYDTVNYQHLMTLPHEGVINDISWRFDGSQIVTSSRTGDDNGAENSVNPLIIWDVNTGQAIRTFNDLQYQYPQWSPTEDIISVIYDNRVSLIDAYTGQIILQSSSGSVFKDWKPDGSALTITNGGTPAFYTRSGEEIPPYPIVLGATLIDDENDWFQYINDDEIINLEEVPSHLEIFIRLARNTSVVQSVLVELNDERFVLNQTPFLFPLPPIGTYTITSTPYTEPNAQGIAGTPLTVTFTITDSSVVNTPPTADASAD